MSILAVVRSVRAKKCCWLRWVLRTFVMSHSLILRVVGGMAGGVEDRRRGRGNHLDWWGVERTGCSGVPVGGCSVAARIRILWDSEDDDNEEKELDEVAERRVSSHVPTRINWRFETRMVEGGMDWMKSRVLVKVIGERGVGTRVGACRSRDCGLWGARWPHRYENTFPSSNTSEIF